MTESIVLQVCRQMKVAPADFFDPNKRTRLLVRARLVAFTRLRAAGFSLAGIARATRRNYATVRYWFKPKIREASNRRARNYWRDRGGNSHEARA